MLSLQLISLPHLTQLLIFLTFLKVIHSFFYISAKALLPIFLIFLIIAIYLVSPFSYSFPPFLPTSLIQNLPFYCPPTTTGAPVAATSGLLTTVAMIISIHGSSSYSFDSLSSSCNSSFSPSSLHCPSHFLINFSISFFFLEIL